MAWFFVSDIWVGEILSHIKNSSQKLYFFSTNYYKQEDSESSMAKHVLPFLLTATMCICSNGNPLYPKDHGVIVCTIRVWSLPNWQLYVHHWERMHKEFKITVTYIGCCQPLSLGETFLLAMVYSKTTRWQKWSKIELGLLKLRCKRETLLLLFEGELKLAL